MKDVSVWIGMRKLERHHIISDWMEVSLIFFLRAGGNGGGWAGEKGKSESESESETWGDFFFRGVDLFDPAAGLTIAGTLSGCPAPLFFSSVHCSSHTTVYTGWRQCVCVCVPIDGFGGESRDRALL